MARKIGLAPGVFLLLGFGWLISKCDGGSSSATTITADSASLSSSSVVSSSPAEPVETMFVNATVLNQRSAPDGLIVSRLSGGNAVTIYERREKWVRISPDSAAPLWVSSSHLCSNVGCYRPAVSRSRKSAPAGRSRSDYVDGTCPCSGRRVCIGPRGGRYCITSGGNKRYGV